LKIGKKRKEAESLEINNLVRWVIQKGYLGTMKKQASPVFQFFFNQII
jgi:hypothetical protein